MRKEKRKEKRVCIVGASGAVGQEIIKVLEGRDFPISELKLLGSKRSLGKEMEYKGKGIEVGELSKDSFKGMDIVLFSASSEVSKGYSKYALESGAVMIDNSAAYRMDEDVPLVIPEINKEEISKHKGIIANPNCSTIILLMGVYPIHKLSKVKRIICSTYQSASGAGARAMDELVKQTKEVLGGADEVRGKIFPHRIAFNLFSHDTTIDEGGSNIEERKMINESRKILKYPKLKLGVTCIRVPILRAHCESVTLELEDNVSVEAIREALIKFSGVKLVDDRARNHFPMPVESSESYDVLVGRVREEEALDKGVSLFISGDQLLKGAALNAVQIAEHLV